MGIRPTLLLDSLLSSQRLASDLSAVLWGALIATQSIEDI